MSEKMKSTGITYHDYIAGVNSDFFNHCGARGIRVDEEKYKKMGEVIGGEIVMILAEKSSAEMLSGLVLRSPIEWCELSRVATDRLRERNGESWWIVADQD